MIVRLVALLPPLAWLAMWLLSRSPLAYLLSHELLGESRFSPPVATLLFAAGWLLMVVAMMLPGALAGLGRVGPRPGAFLSAFLSVWLAFGLVFAFSDMLVHAWLEPRFPEVAALLPGVALLVAGMWLWLRRYLTPTWARHLPAVGSSSTRSGALAGWRHGLSCLHSCWALMLAMTAVGHGSLPMMLAFAVAMIVARRGSLGRRRDSLPARFSWRAGVRSAPSFEGDV